MAKKETNKIKCRVCLSEKVATRDFYSSKSELYNATRRMDICKDCILDRYNKLLTLYECKSNEAFRSLCMNLDVFYSEEVYHQCINSDNFIGEYMRIINSKKETRDMTSMNNLLNSNEINGISLEDGTVDDKTFEFWGEGFNSTEYNRLEKNYKKYTKHYPSETLQEQMIIKILCELENEKDKCRQSNDMKGYKDMVDQISKKMAELNVLPSKIQKYGENKKITPGQLILEIETTEPIPSKHPEFDDVDKVEWWVKRYLSTPFRRLFGLENGDLTYEDVEGEKYEDHKNKRKK